MSMAAAIESRTAKAWPSRIAAIDICSDLQQAEAIWRSLELQFSTPFQRFDFLSPWLRQVGDRENLLPFIVIACDAERRPLLLLPLTLSHRRGIRTASFMGGKHATFNMPLWQRDFAASATATDLEVLVSGIREYAAADVLALAQQPQRWQGWSNPMMLLASQPSANDCPLLTMAPDAAPAELIANSFRRRLEARNASYKSFQAIVTTLHRRIPRSRGCLTGSYPSNRSEWPNRNCRTCSLSQAMQEFIRAACMKKLGDGSHAIDIHALETDDEVLAMFAGVADGRRFSMMFNTYTMSDNSRHSPGLILTRNIIDHYAGLGYRELDLGIGSDEYKRWFCKSTEPIFDSFIPLSPRGKAAAGAMSSFNRAKHLVKHNQALFQMAQRLRSALRR